MKTIEEIAFHYLSSLGHSTVIYEPDGNIPPDFLVDGRIAVEVRKLNQHTFLESGEPRGIETEQFALLNIMKEVLSTFGPPSSGRSWFVRYRFRRPLPSLKKLKVEVRNLLLAFREGQIEGEALSSVDGQFSLSVNLASKVFEDHFVLAGYTDFNASGWLNPELEKNIRLCIREKTTKVARMREKYPLSWLMLIDYIGYGTNESLHIDHDWDKIIVVNPLDAKRAYEL